eukprot:TRINITY_DN2688_c0_g1_i1.p1 TRINITY_DN2688_c0_g1~~TRINITY_DN2688_c0_g1_i1.p1  ORF type:complete len:508 (+),score=152.07 TRINITY_DN2688_c0_g1_i1:21-1544(+)
MTTRRASLHESVGKDFESFIKATASPIPQKVIPLLREEPVVTQNQQKQKQQSLTDNPPLRPSKEQSQETSVKSTGSREAPPAKIYQMNQWVAKCMSNGVVVEGLRNGDKWRTSAITERIDSVTLSTVSGSTYVLVGKMRANTDLMPDVCKAFEDGFPVDWKELLTEPDSYKAFNGPDVHKRKHEEDVDNLNTRPPKVLKSTINDVTTHNQTAAAATAAAEEQRTDSKLVAGKGSVAGKDAKVTIPENKKGSKGGEDEDLSEDEEEFSEEEEALSEEEEEKQTTANQKAATKKSKKVGEQKEDSSEEEDFSEEEIVEDLSEDEGKKEKVITAKVVAKNDSDLSDDDTVSYTATESKPTKTSSQGKTQKPSKGEEEESSSEEDATPSKKVTTPKKRTTTPRKATQKTATTTPNKTTTPPKKTATTTTTTTPPPKKTTTTPKKTAAKKQITPKKGTTTKTTPKKTGATPTTTPRRRTRSMDTATPPRRSPRASDQRSPRPWWQASSYSNL